MLRGFYQLNPLVNRVLPVEFSGGLLNCAALVDIGGWILLEVPQRGGREGLELFGLDGRDDTGALISLEREMPHRSADYEPTRRCRLHDRQLGGLANRACQHRIDGRWAARLRWRESMPMDRRRAHAIPGSIYSGFLQIFDITPQHWTAALEVELFAWFIRCSPNARTRVDRRPPQLGNPKDDRQPERQCNRSRRRPRQDGSGALDAPRRRSGRSGLAGGPCQPRHAGARRRFL